jgi:hypothetical protein
MVTYVIAEFTRIIYSLMGDRPDPFVRVIRYFRETIEFPL